jgi:hypothetical protein
LAQRKALTLGTCKVTLLLARCDGTVDVALESLVARVTELVVGQNVLLDSLTAVGAMSARDQALDGSMTRCVSNNDC